MNKLFRFISDWHQDVLIRRLISRNFHFDEFNREKKIIVVADITKRYHIISRIEAVSLGKLQDWYGWRIYPVNPEFL